MLAGIGTLLGVIGIVCTLLPITRGTQWWVRIWDFPRVQVAVLLAMGIAILGWSAWRNAEADAGSAAFFAIAAALCLGAFAYQLALIRPYSRLARIQVAGCQDRSPSREFRILISNVRQQNRRSGLLLRHIQTRRPDLIFALECDEWWVGQFDTLQHEYPFTVRHPQSDGYGFAVLSRLPIPDAKVRYLREPHIPSIHLNVELPNGECVRCIGLHPSPPVPKYAEETDQRDAELVMVAHEMGDTAGPSIVFGDLNDVAWSPTTKLFQQLSGMLDPRVGRGQFNTFHADYPFLRYPLDHVFLSPHFLLAHLEVLPHVGSDHFPIFAVLHLESAKKAPAANQRQQPKVTEDAEEMASEILAQANTKLTVGAAPPSTA